MKTITAIVRTTSLEKIVKSLEEAGIKGMTIMEVKGTGEQVQVFEPYTVHSRLDIIVPDEKVEGATNIILREGHSGFAGDGLIAVFPMDCVTKIRTKSVIDNNICGMGINL